jgi:hypothetical protein
MRVLPLLTLACTLLAFPAAAQATRTWVSGVGDDVNPCSRTAPCKTFAGALAKTTAGGEINAIDSGGFGAVTITKAVTIDGHNVLSGVLASGTNGITVTAGAGDVVVLRGLDLQGLNGTGLVGVRFTAGKALHVEDCTIAAFGTHGISFEPAAADSQLFVKNTVISEIAPASLTAAGINLVGGTATLDHVTITNSGKGIVASTAAKVTVHQANLSGQTLTGVLAGATTSVSIERSVIAANGTGVQGDVGSTVRLSDTLLSHNTVGLSGDVTSFGNNRVAAGNTTDGAPTTTVSQQ